MHAPILTRASASVNKLVCRSIWTRRAASAVGARGGGGLGHRGRAFGGDALRCRRDGCDLAVVAGEEDTSAGEECRREGVVNDPEEGLVRGGPHGGDGFQIR